MRKNSRSGWMSARSARYLRNRPWPGRIEFVTFHQSMACEEFVEGRQPMTGADEGEDTSSAGFRLETVPGIFRRIAKRAETSRGHSSEEKATRDLPGALVVEPAEGDADVDPESDPAVRL